ncbi:MAG: hypothetical protein IT208_06560 [Chthonomonadales bacterium]|nr:hypothetical protein [Chthonomonadales bacterium]
MPTRHAQRAAFRLAWPAAIALLALALAPGGRAMEQPPLRDTMPDTWTATDALGRTLPGFEQVGPPRPDRQVGIFYFLWLGAHVNGGPYDISKILAQDPTALQNAKSPLWGPLHAPHHWGESLSGYYLSDDPWVLRRHAQMLTDAGVDAVIFDVTNQFTYRKEYMALLKAFSEVRAAGGRVPRIAFLCPFWDPPKVVRELYRDLYAPGLYPDLWYRWEGKPLILADPGKLEPAITNSQQDHPEPLEPGHTLGQSFAADRPFRTVGGTFPTWREKASEVTLSLRRGGPDGPVVVSRRFARVQDSGWLQLEAGDPLPAGAYYLEISAPKGRVGWWSHSADVLPTGQAYADGKPAPGDRTLRIGLADPETDAIRGFFTFRRPQPDYFQGPTEPNMWSWLEVYPQHVFRNARGQKEQMSVGVAQNALDGRLGTFTEEGAHGRTWHDGKRDTSPGAVRRGPNFAEQWERALREDPRFLFVTGWNEWIAGRFDEFVGHRLPVMFVDQFNEELSRDIEPMKGGHGDDYYWQLASYIRRYKGVRPPPRPSAPATIRVDGGFGQWEHVRPEYRDDAGDTAHRDHPGWNTAGPYINVTGRNDFTVLKVARDPESLYFYARTREPITPAQGSNWMVLLIDADANPETGWEGFDYAINRGRRGSGAAVVERCAGGWSWEPVGEARLAVEGAELHLAVPRALLGMEPTKGKLRLHFQWADNVPESGNVLDFWQYGDAAPNGRFRYVFAE